MSNLRIQLSDHFTYPRLLHFVAPLHHHDDFHIHHGVVDGSSSQITSAKRRSRR